LDPSQTTRFIGWQLNFQTRELKMTDKRRTELLQILFQTMEKAEKREQMRCRQLASLLGSLNFLRTQFPMASLYMSQLNATRTRAVKKSGWDGMTTLTPTILGEIKWWIKTINHNQPHSWAPLETTTTLTTDASPWGWGATLERAHEETTYVWGLWSPRQKMMTSNQKELTAIQLALRESIRLLPCGSGVKIRSDNTAAVYALKRWRANERRVPTMREISNLVRAKECSLYPSYLPGIDNGAADKLSRMGVSAEYCMTTMTLRKVQKMIDVQLTLDVFANEATAQLPRYCTLKRSDERAVAVDGLNVDWRREVVLLHSPPSLILQTIQKAIRERVKGVLLVPSWKGQIWTPLLNRLSRDMVDFGPYQTATRRTTEMISQGWLLPPGNLHAHTMGT
jgi:ribonuclease HI